MTPSDLGCGPHMYPKSGNFFFINALELDMFFDLLKCVSKICEPLMEFVVPSGVNNGHHNMKICTWLGSEYTLL